MMEQDQGNKAGIKKGKAEHNAMTKTIKTTWEVRTYDVWGNEKEGYEVNDTFVSHREFEIDCPVEVYNAGTPQEFAGAYPTNADILKAVDGKKRIKISVVCQTANCFSLWDGTRTDGDDVTIYVTHEPTGYPLGELYCTSHTSLSPIRERHPDFIRGEVVCLPQIPSCPSCNMVSINGIATHETGCPNAWKQVVFYGGPDKVRDLRKAYNAAVKDDLKIFTWEDHKFATSYAKYFLEYLDGVFKIK